MPHKEDPIKSLIPYDVNRGGQVIEKLDLTFVNHNRKSKLFQYASSKLEDIKQQYDQTIALWEWNEYVDTFDINFDPIIGKVYYMYEATTNFVSMISPAEFRRNCIGATKLTSDGYWEKVIL